MDTPHDTSARPRRRCHPIWRTLAVLAAAAALGFAWFFGSILLLFGSVQAGIHVSCLTGLCLGLFALILGWAAGWRWLRRIAAVVVLIAIAVSGTAAFHRWYTVDRYDRVHEAESVGYVDWPRFAPFREGNALPVCDAPAEFRFQDSSPRIRAAYALYPIAAAAIQALGDKETYGGGQAWQYRSFGGSDDLFAWLYDSPGNYSCDAVFGLAPSDDQVAAAAEHGVAFNLTPIARDAFVFFVHADNPCTNLTTAQVRDIYSGRARTWRDVGVPFDARLVPFQRNENSGSQTTLERIMGGTPIMPPLKEDRLGGMGDIFHDVADYRNRSGAIGFSFRYYATELVNAGKIRLLSLDGVPPTPENIRSGRYPFVIESYLVTTTAPRSPDVQRLAAFLTSPSGRALVTAVGYVPP
ncbi:MAG: substrate-binding domain-containing protein [Kiritimatiellae bacterium]|nr:substrate-binding domain-containing protein [Kiritimatiellia bacterium]